MRAPPVGNVAAACEPYAAPRLHVADEPLDERDASGLAAYLRVPQRRQAQPFAMRAVELAHPIVERGLVARDAIETCGEIGLALIGERRVIVHLPAAWNLDERRAAVFSR